MVEESRTDPLISPESRERWDKVARLLTKDALLGGDSRIFQHARLIGRDRYSIELFFEDTILVNELNHASFDSEVVFRNFGHFLDLFEELSAEIDPKNIETLVGKSLQRNMALPQSIYTRAGELADVVIGRFFIGEDVKQISEKDLEGLKVALRQDKLAGWVFLFHLLRIPAHELKISFQGAEHLLSGEERVGVSWKKVVQADNESYFKRKGLKKVAGEWQIPQSLSHLEEDIYPFLERYLSNPVLFSHMAYYYRPESDENPLRNEFIESHLDSNLINSRNEIYRDMPKIHDVKEDRQKLSRFMRKGRIIPRGDEIAEHPYVAPTYVESGPSTERVKVVKIVPEKCRRQLQEADEWIEKYFRAHWKEEDEFDLRIVWERYLLTIDEILLRVQNLVDRGRITEERADELVGDLGNYAWKVRGKRKLTPTIVEEREQRIARFENYFGIKGTTP